MTQKYILFISYSTNLKICKFQIIYGTWEQRDESYYFNLKSLNSLKECMFYLSRYALNCLSPPKIALFLEKL